MGPTSVVENVKNTCSIAIIAIKVINGIHIINP